MKNLKMFYGLMYIVIVLSYIGVTFYSYETLISSLLVIISMVISFAWLKKDNKKVKMNRILIIYISILLVLITKKPNLISLALIGVMVIVTDNIKIDIDVRKYIKIALICFGIVLLSYFIFNFNKNYDVLTWRISSNQMEYRYSLGFAHPNQAMFKWLAICLGSLALCKKDNVFKRTLIIGIITVVIYKFTLSRTTVVIVFSLIVLLNLLKNNLDKIVPKFYKKVIALTPIIFLIISYFSIYLDEFKVLNALFSGRFSLYKNYVQIAGFNLFGNRFIETNAMLDNSYLHMLLSKGIVFTVVYVSFMYLLIIKSKNITVCDFIIILGYFTAGLTETILFKFDLIVLIILLLNRQKAKKMEENDERTKKNTQKNTLLLVRAK